MLNNGYCFKFSSLLCAVGLYIGCLRSAMFTTLRKLLLLAFYRLSNFDFSSILWFVLGIRLIAFYHNWMFVRKFKAKLRKAEANLRSLTGILNDLSMEDASFGLNWIVVLLVRSIRELSYWDFWFIIQPANFVRSYWSTFESVTYGTDSVMDLPNF